MCHSSGSGERRHRLQGRWRPSCHAVSESGAFRSCRRLGGARERTRLGPGPRPFLRSSCSSCWIAVVSMSETPSASMTKSSRRWIRRDQPGTSRHERRRLRSRRIVRRRFGKLRYPGSDARHRVGRCRETYRYRRQGPARQYAGRTARASAATNDKPMAETRFPPSMPRQRTAATVAAPSQNSERRIFQSALKSAMSNSPSPATMTIPARTALGEFLEQLSEKEQRGQHQSGTDQAN